MEISLANITWTAPPNKKWIDPIIKDGFYGDTAYCTARDEKGGAGPPVIFVGLYKVVQPPLLQLVYNLINYAYHKSWSFEF